MNTAKPAYLFFLMLLASMTASAEQSITEGVADTISEIYSDIDMRARMAIKADAEACQAEQCIENIAFDTQVEQIGAVLASNAYEVYPELRKRIPGFLFSVAEKKESGMASNAGGRIVVFRGLQQFNFSDEAMTLLIAREMGHVIGGHHDKNTSTKIIISVLAGVLFPAVTLISASNVAAQATTATSVATSVASTATSFVGSEVAMSRIKPSQLKESDDIAVAILNAKGWDIREVANELSLANPSDNSWLEDLQSTTSYLEQLIEREDDEINSLGIEVEHDRERLEMQPSK